MGERGKAGIYLMTCTPNGKRYIGQALSIGDRWLAHRSHMRRGRHSNLHMQRICDKHGVDSFTYEVLAYCEPTAETLMAAEDFFITQLRPELNLVPAQSSPIGFKHPPRTDEFRKRMSEMSRGKKHSEETKALIREIAERKRQDGTMYRPTPEHRETLKASAALRFHTPEVIEKRRATMTGRKHSPEHIAKRVAKLIGHITSELTKQRIGEANRGRQLGTKQSPETIEKRVAPLRGKSRPQHVVDAMHSALKATRQPTLDAIKAALLEDMNLNQTHLAERLGCGRQTIRKVKRELSQ